jgi:hypothetical protein
MVAGRGYVGSSGTTKDKHHMAIRLGDKIERVIRFLLGVRNPRIATALAGYGFKEADMAEGWILVHGLGQGKLAVLPVASREMETLQKLDAWENHWFPIASAVLERHHPAVHARVFLNLAQAEGPEVAVSVGTFVSRYDDLSAEASKHGPEGTKARDVLTSRGLTPGIIEEARALLAALTKVSAPVETPSQVDLEAQLEEAEAKLWAWYLEWSRVARVAIKQRVLLRQLGFLSTARRGSEESEEDEGATGGAVTGGAVASGAGVSAGGETAGA